MSDQQQLREQREALLQAVNRHELEAVRSFIDPSFAGKSKSGSTLVGYEDTVRMLEQLFAPGTNYDEMVEIENIEVSGDSAKLVLRRVARAKSPNTQAFGILMVVVLVNAVSMLVSFLQGRLALWEGVVGFLVFVAMIWVAFYVRRRSVYEESRAQETWRLIDGRWLLVEEQQL
ncbi:MAG: hypothetical protein IH991_09780 [Planctomycetes bacterium]|nr:hypothetical protein [Planctomycetota bacterium]